MKTHLRWNRLEKMYLFLKNKSTFGRTATIVMKCSFGISVFSTNWGSPPGLYMGILENETKKQKRWVRKSVLLLYKFRGLERQKPPKEYSDSRRSSIFQLWLSKKSKCLHFYNLGPNGNYQESLKTLRVVSRVPAGACCSPKQKPTPKVFFDVPRT